MGKRREARERAVQFLFQHDLNPPENLDAELEQFWNSQRSAVIAEEKGNATWGEKPAEPAPPTTDEASVRLFADPLIRGALERDAAHRPAELYRYAPPSRPQATKANRS